MATFENPTYGSTMHDHQSQPVPSAPEGAMALDSSINGAAIQQNAVPAFPSSPPPSEPAQAPQAHTPQTMSAPEPVPSQPQTALTPPIMETPSKLDSGIDPVAPFANTEQRKTDLPAAIKPDEDASLIDDMGHAPSLVDNTHSADLAPSDSQIPSQIEPLPASPPSADPALPVTDAVASDATLDIKPGVSPVDEEMPDLPIPKVAREREDDDAEEPLAKRTKTESGESAIESDAQSSPVLPSTETATDAAPATDATPAASLPTPAPSTVGQTRPVVTTDPAPFEEWGSLTDVQKIQLQQQLQNLKKGRHAKLFTKPVDYVALNIPSYPQVIKKPMDLSAIDKKLRNGEYGSVADYVNDFNLIVDNCMTFNGPSHPVSQAAENLRAQFQTGLRRIAKAGEGAATIEPKKRRSSLGPLPQRDTKPREPRTSLGAPSTQNGNNQTFALPQVGNPLIRRTSMGIDGRPKREIHKPAPRDLPYSSAKPKKKKFQMELKFCEHVVGELKKGRYSHLMYPFKTPVDAVALALPQYHKIIRKPMDFQTITDKLGNGEYENAKEFEADVRLVFENCNKFNGPGHPVTALAKQLESHFDQEMSQKSNWISLNAPDSAPQSPDADSESEVEEEEEEEEEVNEDRDEAIKSIHQQIAELSAKAMALSSNPVPKKPVKDKKKGGKAAKVTTSKDKRKSIPTPARPDKKASKPKPVKPVKVLSTREKEEISERIGELSGDETARAAELIKAGLRKSGRHDLADRPDEELEFDIDAIPNDVLYQLLMLVRGRDGTTDYRPVSQVKHSTNGTSKHKKNHKSMSKSEQQDTVRRLQGQMQQFDPKAKNGANSSSPDPAAAASDDDDDTGSESEEE